MNKILDKSIYHGAWNIKGNQYVLTIVRKKVKKSRVRRRREEEEKMKRRYWYVEFSKRGPQFVSPRCRSLL